MLKKILIGIVVIIILVLLGLGGLYFTDNFELVMSLIGAEVSSEVVILPESAATEAPTDESPPTLTPTVTPIPPPSPTSAQAMAESDEAPAGAGPPAPAGAPALEASETLSSPVTLTDTLVISATEGLTITLPTTMSISLPLMTATLTLTPVGTSTIALVETPTVTSAEGDLPPSDEAQVAVLITPTPTVSSPPSGQGASDNTSSIPSGLVPTPNLMNVSGDWDFNFGHMSLSQSGVSVSGEYRWYGAPAGAGELDKGRITGSFIYDTNQFRGLWISQNPVVQGFLDWRLVDGVINGAFENNRLKGQWCGVRPGVALPPGCGFSGVWNIHFGDPGNLLGQATLTQTGPWVAGSYTAGDGRSGVIDQTSITIIEITEAILQGSWREADGSSGRFEWRLNQLTNQTFEGRRQEGNSEWCGWRVGAEKPQPCGF